MDRKIDTHLLEFLARDHPLPILIGNIAQFTGLDRFRRKPSSSGQKANE